jgi:hypothetical protein
MLGTYFDIRNLLRPLCSDISVDGAEAGGGGIPVAIVFIHCILIMLLQNLNMEFYKP